MRARTHTHTHAHAHTHTHTHTCTHTHAHILARGPPKTGDGCDAHTTSLVSAARLEGACAALAPLTGVHVYAVAPAPPMDAVELRAGERAQAEALFAAGAGVAGGGNGLGRADVLGAVRCGEVGRAEVGKARGGIPAAAPAAKPAAAAAAKQPAAAAPAKV